MSYPQQQPQSYIEIKTSYFFLAFLLALFKPQASINNGPPFTVGWGTTPVPVPPGQYQVEVWMPYLFLPQMGKNGIVVDVPAGGGVQVWWKAPWIVFMRGAILPGPPSGGPAGQAPAAQAPAAQPPWAAAGAAPAAAASSAAGGWHADPAGRHEQRYYDGTAWTDHVVDAGVQSTDPVGG